MRATGDCCDHNNAAANSDYGFPHPPPFRRSPFPQGKDRVRIRTASLVKGRRFPHPTSLRSATKARGRYCGANLAICSRIFCLGAKPPIFSGFYASSYLFYDIVIHGKVYSIRPLLTSPFPATFTFFRCFFHGNLWAAAFRRMGTSPTCCHCEERSDVAIRSPCGNTDNNEQFWAKRYEFAVTLFNIATVSCGEYGLPHQCAHWFAMTA